MGLARTAFWNKVNVINVPVDLMIFKYFCLVWIHFSRSFSSSAENNLAGNLADHTNFF